MKQNEFLDFVLDSLSSISYTVQTRKMFGGYGLYISAKIFGIITSDQELYFKAGNSKAGDFFSKYYSKQFSYDKNGKIVRMSYWHVPSEVLEDSDTLLQWMKVSLDSCVTQNS